MPVFLVSPNTYAAFSEDPARWLRALLVPWVVAGLPLAAMTLRMVRATFPEVLAEDYVRTARGKGLAPRRIALRHTLPVALPPTFSLAGAYVPMLIANVILVEAVFGIPGLYRLIPSAIDNANFPVLQAIVVVGTVIVVVVQRARRRRPGRVGPARAAHHGSGRPSRKKPPVGPSSGSSAAHTTPAAPSGIDRSAALAHVGRRSSRGRRR